MFMRTVFIFLIVIVSGFVHAQTSARPDHYLTQSPTILDTGFAEFAGLDHCGRQYGFANKELNIDDLVSLRCAIGGNYSKRPYGTSAITSVVHQLLFQDITRNSHQTSICQKSFFNSYNSQPAFRAQLNAKLREAFRTAKKPLSDAIAKKERYDLLSKTDTNVYNGSDAEHRELIALGQQKQAFETAITLLPKTIPLGNNPLVEDLVIKSVKSGASEDQFLKDFSVVAKQLEVQAAKSVATLSSPSMRAKDGSYKVTRDMEAEFVQSGAMQALIENSGATPRAKNIALCQMRKIYGTGARITDGVTSAAEMAGLTALSYLAPPIGTELAVASLEARSAYAARALMLASRSTHFAIQTVTFLSSLPSIRKKCFDKNFLSSPQRTCDANTSYAAVLKESTAAECAANIALAATSFMKWPSLAELKPGTAQIAANPVLEKAAAQTTVSAADRAQMQLWTLAEQGRSAEANQLRSTLMKRLESSPIKTSERLNGSLPEGQGTVGDPHLITLEDGTRGIWKAHVTNQQSSGGEMGAYLIDHQLGLNKVPITVRRKIGDQDGTLQLFVGGAKPTGKADPADLALLDTLLQNSDRHGGNVLSANGRTVAIDNGLSYVYRFKESPDAAQLIREQRGTLSHSMMNHAIHPTPANEQAFEAAKAQVRTRLSHVLGSPAVLAKLKSTTPEQWTELLKHDLDPRALGLFLKHRQEILNEVEHASRDLDGRLFP